MGEPKLPDFLKRHLHECGKCGRVFTCEIRHYRGMLTYRRVLTLCPERSNRSRHPWSGRRRQA